MKYKLIQEVHGHIITSEYKGNYEFTYSMVQEGFKLTGLNNNQRQRPELQMQPVFQGLVGPLWDGDGIRYEDSKIFSRMSR